MADIQKEAKELLSKQQSSERVDSTGLDKDHDNGAGAIGTKRKSGPSGAPAPASKRLDHERRTRSS